MEREPSYKEKTSLQDFLKGNALNLELHHLYKYYLANNNKASVCKCTEIKILNEVYKQYAKLHSSTPRTYTTLKVDMSYVRYWYSCLQKEQQNDDAVEFVACLLMAVLTVVPSLSSFERVFLRSLREHIKKCRYYENVYSAIMEFKKCYGTYDVAGPIPETIRLSSQNVQAVTPTMRSHKVQPIKAPLSSCANSIPVSVIAERILNMPNKVRGQMFKDLNTLLVGTAWDAKAKDILRQISEEEKAQEAEVRRQPVIRQTSIEHFDNHPGASFIDFSDSNVDSEELAQIIANKGLVANRKHKIESK